MPSTHTIDSADLIGKSDAMHQIYKIIGRVCNKDCAILLMGEKGVGKEMVARALHYYSRHSASAFRVLPGEETKEASDEDLLGIGETHSTDFTCYIPEWTSLPLFVHHQLLKIHKTKEYRCSHGDRNKRHNVHFIASTSRNLKEDLESGRVPLDLFYDWNFLPVFIPPLRERKEDISIYANHFLELLAAETRMSPKALSPEATELLLNHNWPANLTELKAILKTALHNCRGNYIRPEHLPGFKKTGTDDSEAIARLELFLNSKLSSYVQGLPVSLQGNLYPFLLPHLEKSLFQYALKRSKGNKNKAAQILGLHRNTLNKKLQKMEPL